MPLNPDFPSNPYTILDPAIRWYPGRKEIEDVGREKLVAPLVDTIRKGVKKWRDNGYKGASETSKALLSWWFIKEKKVTDKEGVSRDFQYYFAQREAVETAIWLYEVEKARDPRKLLEYDTSDELDVKLFTEDWTRYVFKMATGSGKTKVISLLVLWSYFHKKYEAGSDLSTNFLINAPNIIVLDRLRSDFDGLKIFYNDPMLPDDGHYGRYWKEDFQIQLLIQDQIGNVSEHGNIFLTNIQRVFLSTKQASIDDADTKDYFFGKRPSGKTNESDVDLGKIIRQVPDLLVINDEAHHIHDDDLAWYKNIQDISDRLRKKGSKLSAQFDLTATPKHTDGSIFVNTVCDYPLVEAIAQNVVKLPVLPDEQSRERLEERPSEKFSEMYSDYINLGVEEWRRSLPEHNKMGKKPLLFVMTDDTRNCDEVGEYLETNFPELKGKVLVIHTKNNGEIAENNTGKSKEELDNLRRESREIDDFYNSKYNAVVSVMVLREGWDVQNVVTIVGLRPYKAKSMILPEQTLGRGLRRMYRGDLTVPPERVSVIGTEKFIEFIESIKNEGVMLPTEKMIITEPAERSVVTISTVDENVDKYDIAIPVLSSRIKRNWSTLEQIDVENLKIKPLTLKTYTEEESKIIIFKDCLTDLQDHITELGNDCSICYQNVVGYFVKKVMNGLGLTWGFDILFGKIKTFMETKLFGKRVDLVDPVVLKNMAEPLSIKTIIETFINEINRLSVEDVLTTSITGNVKASETRAYRVENKLTIKDPCKCIFSYFKGDSQFEYDFANFLMTSSDVLTWYKNDMHTNFNIEYQKTDGSIGRYFPDFIIKLSNGDMWIVETKGIDDDDSKKKYARLKLWVDDQNKLSEGKPKWFCMKVMLKEWDNCFKEKPIKNFKILVELFSHFDE